MAREQRQAQEVSDVLDRVVMRVHCTEEAERQQVQQVGVRPSGFEVLTKISKAHAEALGNLAVGQPLARCMAEKALCKQLA